LPYKIQYSKHQNRYNTFGANGRCLGAKCKNGAFVIARWISFFAFRTILDAFRAIWVHFRYSAPIKPVKGVKD
jgi:hypothetical protein